MKYPEGAKEISTASVGSLGPLAMATLDVIPPEQKWVALVVAGVVAVAYVSWRSFLKLERLREEHRVAARAAAK